MATTAITEENLRSTIADNDIVLLDFWASWCGPCRAFGPVFEQASETHPDIVFGKVDTDAQQRLAAGFQVSSIPTLMAFRDDILVFSQPGALGGAQLEQLIEGVRGLDMDQVRAEVRDAQARQADAAEAPEPAE